MNYYSPRSAIILPEELRASIIIFTEEPLRVKCTLIFKQLDTICDSSEKPLQNNWLYRYVRSIIKKLKRKIQFAMKLDKSEAELISSILKTVTFRELGVFFEATNEYDAELV